MALVPRAIADIISLALAPPAAQPALLVHIRKGTFAPVRPPEISYRRRLCAISLIRRAGAPAHKQLFAVLQMPQQSAATVADWLSIAKVDQLTQAALESLLACSFTDIEDVGAADPFCLDEVQSAIGVLAFEPATSTRNSKLGSALRLPFDQVDPSMSGHTRAPGLAQFDEPYGFRETGD
jgi:hypothetical protein